MVDIFQEVDDELRRERLEEFWKEHGSFIITLIVLFVLSTAAASGWRSWSENKNVEKTSALISAMYEPDADKRAEELGAFIVKNEGFHGAMARFVAADKLLGDGKTAAAVDMYEQVIADSGVDDLYRDLARLLSISAQLDKGDVAELTKSIDMLDKKGNPWQVEAQEMRALLAAREGEPAKAEKLMRGIIDNPDAPDSIRGRAEALADVYASQAALAEHAAATRPESGTQDDQAQDGTQDKGTATE